MARDLNMTRSQILIIKRNKLEWSPCTGG